MGRPAILKLRRASSAQALNVSSGLMNREHLPFFPEPLTKDELKSIYENQTAILEWLKSIGHKVDDNETGRALDR